MDGIAMKQYICAIKIKSFVNKTTIYTHMATYTRNKSERFMNTKQSPSEKIIVGLDIGTTKICSVVGRKNIHGKIEVLGMGKTPSSGVSRGVVINIDKTVQAIQKAIKASANQANVNIRNVLVGIAGQHIKSVIKHGLITRKNEEELITKQDLDQLHTEMEKTVVQPGSDIIHVMPQDYTVDHEENIKDPVGMVGSRLEADFNLITALSSDINKVKNCIKRANLRVEELILEPIASSQAVLTDEEKEAGVCLVDIGGGTTDIAIFHEGVIRHTAVIPFGGNVITQDIKQGCKIMEVYAERLKLRFGSAVAHEENDNEVVAIPGMKHHPPKEISLWNLASIIQARMEEIIEFIHKEIITRHFEDKLNAGLVLTGGGAALRGIVPLFAHMVGMEARIGYPNEHLGKDFSSEIKSPMYATAIGLVMCGFQAIDLRNENHKAPSAQKKPYTKAHNNFFKNILDRTHKMLLDDFDDTMD